jgi:hypothetical protein
MALLISSQTCLARLKQVSGVNIQTYLKQEYDLRVIQKQRIGKDELVILKRGTCVGRYDTDKLGLGILEFYMRSVEYLVDKPFLRTMSIGQVFMNYDRFDISMVFDSSFSTTCDVLMKLGFEGVGDLDLLTYDGKVQAYDRLFKFCARKAAVPIVDHVPAVVLNQTDGLLKLANLQSGLCVRITNRDLIPAFRMAYPEGFEVDDEDGAVLFVPKPSSVIDLFGGLPSFVGINWDYLFNKSVEQEVTCVEELGPEQLDEDDVVRMVAYCLNNPSESNYIKEFAAMVALKPDGFKLSNSSSRGLGNLFGSGVLKDRIRVVTDFLKDKLGKASDREAFMYVASKLANMHSNKRVLDIGGVFHIEDRIKK